MLTEPPAPSLPLQSPELFSSLVRCLTELLCSLYKARELAAFTRPCLFAPRRRTRRFARSSWPSPKNTAGDQPLTRPGRAEPARRTACTSARLSPSDAGLDGPCSSPRKRGHRKHVWVPRSKLRPRPVRRATAWRIPSPGLLPVRICRFACTFFVVLLLRAARESVRRVPCPPRLLLATSPSFFAQALANSALAVLLSNSMAMSHLARAVRLTGTTNRLPSHTVTTRYAASHLRPSLASLRTTSNSQSRCHHHSSTMVCPTTLASSSRLLPVLGRVRLLSALLPCPFCAQGGR